MLGNDRSHNNRKFCKMFLFSFVSFDIQSTHQVKNILLQKDFFLKSSIFQYLSISVYLSIYLSVDLSIYLNNTRTHELPVDAPKARIFLLHCHVPTKSVTKLFKFVAYTPRFGKISACGAALFLFAKVAKASKNL